MAIELLVLRLVHVLGGVFWVGTALFMSLFLAPALATAGPSAGQVLGTLRRRGLMTYLPLAAVLTIASGARLMWITSGGLSSAYFASATGRTLAAAGAAAVVAFLVGILVGRPAGTRAGQLTGSLASAPAERRAAIERELATLRRRGEIASAVVVLLLLFGAAGMAVARYLR